MEEVDLQQLNILNLSLQVRHVRKYAKDVETRCLWQFDAPISPHLAAPKTPVSLFRLPSGCVVRV